MMGIIKWFDNGRGVGLIEKEGGGDDVFFDRIAVENAGYITLRAGQLVDFDVKQRPQGDQAVNLRVLR